MMDLAEFLLARIADEEQAARSAERAHPPAGWSIAYYPETMHSARHDPARVLADCEAKRRIVEHYQDWYAAYRADRVGFDRMDQVIALRWVLEQMGLLWADHPDYREEWRP